MRALTDLPQSIGDLLMWSSLPENHFKTFNEKLFDLDNKWIFDANPFIERNFTNKITETWQGNKMLAAYGAKTPPVIHSSITQAITRCFNCKTFQRSPRLYKFEDAIQEPKSLVLHTTGKSIRAGMTFEIMEIIAKNYPHHKVIQIGGENDTKFGFLFNSYEDKTGLPIWETVKIIASSEIFIGCNSGFLHVANCYRKVRKKVLLFELNEDQLNNFWPGLQSNVPNGVWIDFGIEYFNALKYDVGVTYSINSI